MCLLPFGVPTLIIAEDPRLLATAAASYAHWRAETPFAEPAIELRLDTGSASSSGVCLDIKVEGSRLKFGGRGASGTADAVTGQASAIVPADLAGDPAAFTEVVDTLMLFLLARTGRTPVHAAAFVFGDRAILLAGPSGSGKSTLALAAAECGYPVLSDDMIFVQRDPSVVIWGFPRPIHVFPGDAPPGDHPARHRNGKLKAAVNIAAPALRAERPAMIVLDRGEELQLTRIEQADALASLMRLDPGFDLLEQDSREALQVLSSLDAWRLTLTDDPAAAIDLVSERLAE